MPRIKDSCHYGFTNNKIYKVEQLLDFAINDLFTKIQSPHHCLYPLLPRRKDRYITVRPRQHKYELPSCTYKSTQAVIHCKLFV